MEKKGTKSRGALSPKTLLNALGAFAGAAGGSNWSCLRPPMFTRGGSIPVIDVS